MFRLREYITGSMVGEVLAYIGFSRPGMKFVLIGLLSSYLILLDNHSPMRVSR